MCGIAGFLGRFPPDTVRAMASLISHRGPDDEGIFVDGQAGVGLAHRRLSIIDLSPAGHQPLSDASGRYTICYNGEVYNYRELKSELEAAGTRFRGHSDTEVIIELFAREGLACLAKLNGIFAFAIWDATEGELTLVRDGVGVKPLYVCETPRGIAFASEIKALMVLPDLDRTLDPIAAASYLSYLWSPGSRTMLKSVSKLAPGAWTAVKRDGSRRSGTFYRLPDPVPDAGLSDAGAIAGTEAALRTAVQRQMVADVEVGAFLSGGLDSSAVVAFAREHAAPRSLQCFTIHYDERPDEAGEMIADLPYARRAAKHLGVDLHEITVDSSIATDFERLIYHLDEPEADPAAINSLYIAELARSRGIKVLLSGTGGDDIFTGYRRHQAARMDRLWSHVPGFVRSGLEDAAHRLPTRPAALRRVRKLLEAVGGTEAERLAGYFEWLPVETAVGLLKQLEAGAAAEVRSPLRQELQRLAGHRAVEKVLRLDQKFFLTDHNLNYTDKTGMAVGVEIRVPFLDPDLLQWAARLPTDKKIRRGTTKWALRKAMEPHLPKDIIYRPKTGFGLPLRAWLRGELRPMMEDLLAPASIEARGLFDPAAVQRLKRSTLNGETDGTYAILAIMAIELWARRFLAPAPQAIAA